MAPIIVDPQAVSGAGTSMNAVGEGVAAAMSTLTGGFNANTGYDAAGIVFGRQYVSAGASLLKAITAGVNACRNNGYGLQTSAVNYSRAEAASDLSGRAQVLGSPPCPAPVAVPGSPSSSGASVPPPLLWSVVAQFVGSPWPDGNPAEMRAAAAAWRAMAVPLYQVSGDAAGAYNTIAAQRIAEGRLMTADIRDIGSNLAGVASSCQQLAATLEQYAGQVEKTQQAIRQLCDQVGSIGGIVGTFFEFLHGHGEDELHKIADEIETVLTYLGTEADAALALLESAKSSVDSWVLGLEKSADRTFVEFFGDQVGGALATHFNAVADSAEGVFRWGAGMAEGVIALDPTRFASSPDVAGRAWEGVAKFAQLVTNPAAAIASDPQGSLDTVKGLVHADDWSKDRPMLGASQNLLDIASVVIPGVGEAGAAGDAASAVGRVARTSEEPAGAAGTIGKVGEFGRSTAALGGVTKDVAGLTEKLGAIADKPSAPPAGGRPASLTDPVDAGPRAPVAKQPDPESAPAVGRPDEPAGGDVAAGVSDHPTAQVGGERVPGGSDPTTHTPAPAVAAGAGEGAPRLPPVTTTGTDTAAPLSAAERAPAVAGGSGEALKPVGGLAPSASDRLTGLGNSSKFPAADDHASLATDIGTHASVGDGVERGVPLGAGHRDDYGGGDPPPGRVITAAGAIIGIRCTPVNLQARAGRIKTTTIRSMPRMEVPSTSIGTFRRTVLTLIESIRKSLSSSQIRLLRSGVRQMAAHLPRPSTRRDSTSWDPMANIGSTFRTMLERYTALSSSSTTCRRSNRISASGWTESVTRTGSILQSCRTDTRRRGKGGLYTSNPSKRVTTPTPSIICHLVGRSRHRRSRPAWASPGGRSRSDSSTTEMRSCRSTSSRMN